MTDKGKGKTEEGIEGVVAAIARSRVPLGFLCAAGVLWFSEPSRPSLVWGGALASLGETLRVWAAGHLEKGQEVTQSGPYRVTRHPLYVGSAIIAAGVAVASAHAGVALLVAAYMAITIASAIRHEETSMRAAFGDEYDAYAQSRAKPVERSFSWSRALKNKEHKAIAGLLVVASILAVKVALKR